VVSVPPNHQTPNDVLLLVVDGDVDRESVESSRGNCCHVVTGCSGEGIMLLTPAVECLLETSPVTKASDNLVNEDISTINTGNLWCESGIVALLVAFFPMVVGTEALFFGVCVLCRVFFMDQRPEPEGEPSETRSPRHRNRVPRKRCRNIGIVLRRNRGVGSRGGLGQLLQAVVEIALGSCFY